MAQGNGLVDSLGRHPAVLLDDAAPRPDQNPAKAGQRHPGERKEQLGQAGPVGRVSGWNIRRRDGGGTGIRRHASRFNGAAGPTPMQNWRVLRRGMRGAMALFFSTFAPYIGGAGSPAMEINFRCNNPFGPWALTRLLHPSLPFQSTRSQWGRIR